MMRDFIDISLSPSDQERPYLIYVFENGSIVGVTRHARLDAVANYCKQRALPVISSESFVRAELYKYGIQSGPPLMKAVHS
jgi:hypothetical protein